MCLSGEGKEQKGFGQLKGTLWNSRPAAGVRPQGTESYCWLVVGRWSCGKEKE